MRWARSQARCCPDIPLRRPGLLCPRLPGGTACFRHARSSRMGTSPPNLRRPGAGGVFSSREDSQQHPFCGCLGIQHHQLLQPRLQTSLPCRRAPRESFYAGTERPSSTGSARSRGDELKHASPPSHVRVVCAYFLCALGFSSSDEKTREGEGGDGDLDFQKATTLTRRWLAPNAGPG
jgi:hypothetical protein